MFVGVGAGAFDSPQTKIRVPADHGRATLAPTIGRVAYKRDVEGAVPYSIDTSSQKIPRLYNSRGTLI